MPSAGGATASTTARKVEEEAVRYARAAAWVFLAWLAQRLRLPVAGEWYDEALLRRFACALDFEPAVVERPAGYRCEHMTMTAGGGTVRNLTCWSGCHMSAYF